jgi:hypothetical protein
MKVYLCGHINGSPLHGRADRNSTMRSRTLISGRVSGGEQFSADYSDGSEADQTIKAIVDKIVADAALKRMGKRE